MWNGYYYVNSGVHSFFEFLYINKNKIKTMERININGIELQCSDMRFSDSTVIVVPDYKGRRMTVFYNGQQTENIKKSDEMQMMLLEKIEEKYKNNCL